MAMSMPKIFLDQKHAADWYGMTVTFFVLKKSYGQNIFHTCHRSSNFLVIAFLREDYYTMYISDDTIYISFV